ncbi:DNA-processing protein DprA [candidate division KSB1 bacterium]|nr:DNA-processing protein DprA [candidate division KSB1 bacterium]
MDPYGLLCLLCVPGIGSLRVRKILERFGSADAAFRTPWQELVQVEGIDKRLALAIKNYNDFTHARQQISLAKKYKINILTFWDAKYPPLLKNIFNPPVLLYYCGEWRQPDYQGLAIVGTRVPSPYGRLVSEQMTRELCARGVTLISGLARGVDTIVHRTTVLSGGRTVAVLGSGLDRIYPDENRGLAEKIKGNGVLVSEFPIGTGPDAPNFPRRNRIIAGLSAGTLVIEAGDKSGALITADFALEQGREVFAVPGLINNPKARGCNTLIQQGAKLVQNVHDILQEFSIPEPERGTSEQLDLLLSPEEQQVYDVLSCEVKYIDRIAAESSISVSRVSTILLSLELKNIVKQVAGKNFCRI